MMIWNIVAPYFSPKEAWGDPTKISGLILMPLYFVRKELGWPCIIHCGTQGKHAKESYHYKGLAVDFHFVIDLPIHKQYVQVEKVLKSLQLADFMGVGYYVDWKHPGFHFDSRGYRVRWWHNKFGYHYF